MLVVKTGLKSLNNHANIAVLKQGSLAAKIANFAISAWPYISVYVKTTESICTSQ